MSDDKTGGSAFPKQPTVMHIDRSCTVMEQGGMTLRDYFAAKAMIAICSQNGAMATYHHKGGTKDMANLLAKDSYAIADAMLKAREA